MCWIGRPAAESSQGRHGQLQRVCLSVTVHRRPRAWLSRPAGGKAHRLNSGKAYRLTYSGPAFSIFLMRHSHTFILRALSLLGSAGKKQCTGQSLTPTRWHCCRSFHQEDLCSVCVCVCRVCVCVCILDSPSFVFLFLWKSSLE